MNRQDIERMVGERLSMNGLSGVQTGHGNDPNDTTTWLPGYTINGRWQLGEKLGQGGMGIVFAAEDLEYPRGPDLAIKVATREALWPALEQEARLMKAAEPAAPHVFGLRHDERTGMPFLVMERLHGQTLHELRGHLDRTSLMRDLVGAAAAVDEMHEHNIVHRDIKPSNLFVEGGYGAAPAHAGVKLLDFGLAHNRGALASALEGTQGYAPPEQIPQTDEAEREMRGTKRSSLPSADIYGLGATAWSMLTDGARPDIIQPCQETEDETILPNQSPAVNRVITRAMQCDPAKRWPSARAMQDALEAALPRHVRDAMAQDAMMQASVHGARGSVRASDAVTGDAVTGDAPTVLPARVDVDAPTAPGMNSIALDAVALDAVALDAVALDAVIHVGGKVYRQYAVTAVNPETFRMQRFTLRETNRSAARAAAKRFQPGWRIVHVEEVR